MGYWVSLEALTVVGTGEFGQARRWCKVEESGWAACLSRQAKMESPCKVQMVSFKFHALYWLYAVDVRCVWIDLDWFIARQTMEPQQLFSQTGRIVFGVDRLNLWCHALSLEGHKSPVKMNSFPT